MAVWQQFDGTFDNIVANRYSAATRQWGTPIIVDNLDSDAYSPQIAVDRNGNAFAVWEQFDGTEYSVFSNRYNGGSWGTATVIENSAGDAYSPRIAVDKNGNAIAVWYQFDGTVNNIVAIRYLVGLGGGWGTAAPIGAGVEHAYNPEIAIDAAGNAIAVWEQWDGTA